MIQKVLTGLMGLTLMAAPVFAQPAYDLSEERYPKTHVSSQYEAGSKFGLGVEAYSFTYEEPGLMKEEGLMYGLFGELSYRSQDNTVHEAMNHLLEPERKWNVFKLEGRVAFGEVDYTSNGTGSIDDIDDWTYEIRGLTGIDLPVTDDFVLTPYLGFGYRYLNDDGSNKVSTTGARGYERESNYFYIPVGIDSGFNLGNAWMLNMNVELDLFIGGKQKSHLGDADPSYNTVENDQDEGYGLRGSLALSKETEAVTYIAQIFARYWDIDNSRATLVTCGGTPCALGYEPANETLEAGVRLGVRF